jgi:hypothetical protein
MKSLSWKMILDSGETPQSIRLLIVCHKQGDAVKTPTVTDVLESNSPLSFKNINKMSKSKILYDRLINMSDIGSSASGVEPANRSNYMTLTGFVRFKRRLAKYSFCEFEEAGSNTEKNDLSFYAISELSATTNSNPRIQANFRLTFYDN